jgi:hypothetical protein
MEKKKSERYWVLLARPVIQTTVVEVKASDYREAANKARQKATKLPDSRWEGSYQPDEYGIDALTGLADSTFAPDEDPEEYMQECAEDYRYMLLKANLDSGEGVLLVEPWLQNSDALSAADLLKDWSIAATELYEQAAGNWIESLEERSKELAPKTSAKVIHLPPHIQKKRTTSKPERDE